VAVLGIGGGGYEYEVYGDGGDNGAAVVAAAGATEDCDVGGGKYPFRLSPLALPVPTAFGVVVPHPFGFEAAAAAAVPPPLIWERYGD